MAHKGLVVERQIRKCVTILTQKTWQESVAQSWTIMYNYVDLLCSGVMGHHCGRVTAAQGGVKLYGMQDQE